MKKLTFKEYIDSKTQLKEIIKNSKTGYMTENIVIKYCRLSIKRNDRTEFINLKPGHKITLEWTKVSEGNSQVRNILFENVKNIDNISKYKTTMENNNLIKWLGRNSREGIF